MRWTLEQIVSGSDTTILLCKCMVCNMHTCLDVAPHQTDRSPVLALDCQTLVVNFADTPRSTVGLHMVVTHHVPRSKQKMSWYFGKEDYGKNMIIPNSPGAVQSFQDSKHIDEVLKSRTHVEVCAWKPICQLCTFQHCYLSEIHVFLYGVYFQSAKLSGRLE